MIGHPNYLLLNVTQDKCNMCRCGISTGMCEKECASVTVQEHVECGCDCGPLDPGTCPPETHTYNR